MTHDVILADDITGACDSGIHFARAGKRTALLLSRDAMKETFADHDVVVVSYESRFLEPAAAAEVAREAVRDCRRAGAKVAYKKIDSTLRGHPGAETEAILQEDGFAAALVCSAMPKTGRLIRDGMLYLNGRPINEMDAGRDPFNPVTSANVAEMLARQTALPIANIGLEHVRAGVGSVRETIKKLIASGNRILVADAVEDGDLSLLALSLRPDCGDPSMPRILPVGAGGFAEALAGSHKAGADPEPSGRMLAVVGSLTSTSMAQLEYATAHDGFRLLELDMEKAFADSDAELKRLASLATLDDRPLLLKNRVPPLGQMDPADGTRAAAIFAAATRMVSTVAHCSILYASGGSTAMAILESLHLASITLEREYMPGVVLSSLPNNELGLRWFISKAGGFGAPETLVRLAEVTLQSTGK